MSSFVHLHVHTEYSLLDGANRISDLILQAKTLGMDSIAITDHGVMYGVVDFYKEAVKNGIKPILGCEVYTSVRSRHDKEGKIDADNGHLILLAKNHTGYKNLMKLVSMGFTEGFYYRPRVDFELLEKYSEGLIALSACLSGQIPKALLQGNYEKAKSLALKYLEIFGIGNFYLELQINGIEEQNLVNQKLVKLGQEMGIPLVCTNDVHYLKKEDARAQEVLMCIQTGKTMEDEDRMSFSTDDFYLKSPEEMQELFVHFPEAMENTVKIAEQCHVELEFGNLHLPEFDVPDGFEPYSYLRKICMEGFEARYGKCLQSSNEILPFEQQDPFCQTLFDKNEVANQTELLDRMEYELTTILQMGYVDYFLIVWDFIKYARDHGIPVGPGRGSAAGSIVAYCLGITNVDPIHFNLLFERFLNPERISMPDIDIDFCYERRQEVIDYVVRKYGEERVAQIITFGTMAARAAIRDVGRAMAIPYSQVDTVAKMIPMQLGMNIEKALEQSKDLKILYEEDLTVAELVDMARKLEGTPRHASTHAAGVVISKKPVMEYVPLQTNDDCITTQFPMTLLEELGLLKMDFLGLRTLTVIKDTVDFIYKTQGIQILIDDVRMDDDNVYRMIGEGKTTGVFQLESGGMTQFMKELQPSSLEDIIAGISLYRPGPMDQIPRYIRNKKDPKSVTYHHPLLEKILDVTYGCMVYQEQVMQIVRDLAGYSLGRSDLVRRAMSKKKKSVMEEERKSFIYGQKDEQGNVIIKGALANGVDEKTANIIFDEMMDFASYAFNKSHAAAYAVVGYQTGWLKYYYPVEFMAALLNSFLGSSDKISQYVHDCHTMGIEILPPDINESHVKFTVVHGKIRFGLAAVKNVGAGAVTHIIKERDENGLFKEFASFCERISGKDVNKKCIESLIKCGGFDSMAHNRATLMASFEKILDGVASVRKSRMEGQLSLFDVPDSKDEFIEIKMDYHQMAEFSQGELLAMEKEMLGIYVSGHPLSEYKELIEQFVTATTLELNASMEETASGEEDQPVQETVIDDNQEADSVSLKQGMPESRDKIKDGQSVIVAGIVSDNKKITTRSNKMMAFVTLEDLYGQMELIVFPNIFEKYRGLVEKEQVIAVNGTISFKEGELPKILCNTIVPLKEIQTVIDTIPYKNGAGNHNGQYNRNSGNNSPISTVFSGNISSSTVKRLKIKIEDHKDVKLIERTLALIKYFSGDVPIFIYIGNTQKMAHKLSVSPCNTLVSELYELLGAHHVKIE